MLQNCQVEGEEELHDNDCNVVGWKHIRSIRLDERRAPGQVAKPSEDYIDDGEGSDCLEECRFESLRVLG